MHPKHYLRCQSIPRFAITPMFDEIPELPSPLNTWAFRRRPRLLRRHGRWRIWRFCVGLSRKLFCKKRKHVFQASTGLRWFQNNIATKELTSEGSPAPRHEFTLRQASFPHVQIPFCGEASGITWISHPPWQPWFLTWWQCRRARANTSVILWREVFFRSGRGMLEEFRAEAVSSWELLLKSWMKGKHR